jgi:hypothetical protein
MGWVRPAGGPQIESPGGCTTASGGWQWHFAACWVPFACAQRAVGPTWSLSWLCVWLSPCEQDWAVHGLLGRRNPSPRWRARCSRSWKLLRLGPCCAGGRFRTSAAASAVRGIISRGTEPESPGQAACVRTRGQGQFCISQLSGRVPVLLAAGIFRNVETCCGLRPCKRQAHVGEERSMASHEWRSMLFLR